VWPLLGGEGTKSNKNAVRLGNTDPDLIIVFIRFLKECFSIDTRRLKFGLQIFSDMDPNRAKRFWMHKLHARSTQFQKVIVTQARGLGTYKKKTQHGVLTVYFGNTRLQGEILATIEKLRELA